MLVSLQVCESELKIVRPFIDLNGSEKYFYVAQSTEEVWCLKNVIKPLVLWNKQQYWCLFCYNISSLGSHY